MLQAGCPPFADWRGLISSLIGQCARYRKGLQQARGKLMPCAQKFRRIVANPHIRVSILPDENLQRQVNSDSGAARSC